jgi:hypothetical protein
LKVVPEPHQTVIARRDDEAIPTTLNWAVIARRDDEAIPTFINPTKNRYVSKLLEMNHFRFLVRERARLTARATY